MLENPSLGISLKPTLPKNCVLLLLAKANHKVVGVAMIEGVATLVGSSEIAGEGWVRINPDTDEWDYKQSSDWNKIN